MEELIVQQRALMDHFDPQRRINLIIDEWGTWHPPTPGRNPAFLWQQNTLRDAFVAAITLNIFNRHADKVAMANIAQTVNVLQALLLTENGKVIRTPTYHVYDLYKNHQGARAIRLESNSDLNVSASMKNTTLTLTAVNTRRRRPIARLCRAPAHRGNRLADAGVPGDARPRRDASQNRRSQRHRLGRFWNPNPRIQHIGVNLHQQRRLTRQTSRRTKAPARHSRLAQRFHDSPKSKRRT